MCPCAATLRTIDSTNGAVESPSYRGYDDVMARIFMRDPLLGSGSAHDVLDHALDALALVDPLLVLRRDELGEQSERDELDADDHQQHAEGEERSRRRCPAPQNQSTRQVEEDDEADAHP